MARQPRTRVPQHRRKKGPVCIVCEKPAVPAYMRVEGGPHGREVHWVCEEHKS